MHVKVLHYKLLVLLFVLLDGLGTRIVSFRFDKLNLDMKIL